MCKISEMNLDTAKYYGYEAQSNQLVEECAELIQAVNKYRRVETGLGQPVAEDKKAIARDNLVEEIADVELMLEQVKYLLQIPEDELLAVKTFKVNKEAGSDERYGFASATGYKGASSVSDPTGVAVAWGHEARAKGCKGAHLILSDWKYVGARYSDGDYMDPYDKESWELTGAKMVVVDGEKIKEDTYYRCIEGEIVEVTEDGEIVEE